MRTLVAGAALSLFALAACGAAARAGDWPQWRGPERTGVARAGPALTESWPEDGPPRLWQSEAIPGGGDGGYGSPVVAGGRVYLYVAWKYSVDITSRTLSERGLKKLGWRAESLPAPLAAQVEKARLSEHRAALPREKRNQWVDDWVGKHLSEEQQKQFGGYVKDRLRRGKDAMALKVLGKLETIKDRRFDLDDNRSAIGKREPARPRSGRRGLLSRADELKAQLAAISAPAPAPDNDKFTLGGFEE